MPFVISKLTGAQSYCLWQELPGGGKKRSHVVNIAGGHGTVNRTSLETPDGVVTQVTDEQLAVLERCHDFQTHMNNGFIKVEKSEKRTRAAKKDMESRDKSAPATLDELTKHMTDEEKASLEVKVG